MADSIDGLSDAELLSVSATAFMAAQANPAVYGVTAPEVTAFIANRATYEGDVTQQGTARAASAAATATKNVSRGVDENDLRTLVARAKGAGADEAAMNALGLPKGGPGFAATVPVAMVDTSERMRHRISWMDAAGGGSKRRPAGVLGAEIWRKIDGAPPTDESQCTFVTLDTASPYDVNYTGADGGKMAHYLIRWRFKDGSLGAWGETVSATITA